MDMFLQVEGVVGGSLLRRHPGSCEIESAEWGMGRLLDGSGLPFGATLPKVFGLVKRADVASVDLARLALLAQLIPKVEFFYMTSTAATFDAITITLTNARIESFKSSGRAGGGADQFEELELSYGRLEVVYRRQKSDGTVEVSGSYTYVP